MLPHVVGRNPSEIFALFLDLAGSKDAKGEVVLSKEEAHGGDFHLFAQLDVDKSGFVDAKEWVNVLTAQAAEKDAKRAGKGQRWLQAPPPPKQIESLY